MLVALQRYTGLAARHLEGWRRPSLLSVAYRRLGCTFNTDRR